MNKYKLNNYIIYLHEFISTFLFMFSNFENNTIFDIKINFYLFLNL